MGREKDRIIKILKDFKTNIEKFVSIDRLIFFGSYARGDNNQNSDIDIIIVSNDFEGKKYFKRSPKFYLSWNYPYDIDIICLTPEELNNKTKQVGVIKDAVKEGIEI